MDECIFGIFPVARKKIYEKKNEKKNLIYEKKYFSKSFTACKVKEK